MSSGPVSLDFSKAIPIGTPDPSPADQQASTLKQSISYGASQNPDQYAKRLTLQKQTGVPPVVSEGNEPQVQQSADVNSLDYEKLVADHPRTTAWASNPDNAAVSGVSEVQRLAQIEKNTQAMRDSNFVMTPLGGVTLDPLKPVKDWLGSTGDLIKNYIQAESQSMDPNDPENRLQGITVPGVRGPNGVTRSYTTSPESTTRAYQNLIAPAGQASTDFLVSQMQPENLAMLGAFSAIPTNTTAGRALHGAIGSYFAGKMGSEGLVQAYQSYREAEQGNTPSAVRDLVGSILNLGMAAEGTYGAAKIGSGSFHENLAETVASTEQSALKQRSPEAFHDAMQKITEGDPSLRVPVDQFMEYFHSKGVAAQTVAEQLGVKNFAEALVSGGDVEVPMADFLSKLDAEHQKSLLQDVVGPSSGMTPRQHEQQQKELDAWMTSGGPESLRAAAAQADAETASTPEYIAAKEELRNRYIGAGETPDVAETLATKDANVYANLAKQVGMKPAELMSLYDPQVKAGNPLEGALYQSSVEKFMAGIPDPADIELSDSDIQNNASGESPASVEALRRVAAEKSAGIQRLRVDTRSGKETPLVGPDAVDAKAGAYERIIARKSDGQWTILDQGAKARPAVLYQPAYHGSPYKFDKFSLEHMGKGEGAQAYGWGLYFAGSKQVAEFYREALTKNDVLTVRSKSGEIIAQGDKISEKGLEAIKLLEIGEQQAGEFKHNKAYYAKKLTTDPEVLKLIDQWKDHWIGYTKEKGQLYEADIPSDDTMLHWDKPLSEQPQKVKEALKSARLYSEGAQDLGQFAGSSVIGAPETGASMYDKLSMQLGKEHEFGGGWSAKIRNDEAASKKLNELGISGIKFLDGSSRGKGEGNHNYVVFDDNAIKVLKTYYQGDAEQPRGWFRVLPDGSFEIGRTKIGDLSTFVHEPAHGYLQMISDLAQRPDASEVLKGDYSKILDFLGAKEGETLSTLTSKRNGRARMSNISAKGKPRAKGSRECFRDSPCGSRPSTRRLLTLGWN
jgi:hypothetical protein